MSETTNKSVWEVLSAINCNERTEEKDGMTYLSWSWAWGYVKSLYPSANYKVRQYGFRPYLFDEELGYLVTTEVTINGETIEMSLPVMDSKNKARKNVAYEYATKYGKKTVEAATMFDINTAIMRCLTKNLAMFGLGHYIYAGEDIPAELSDEPKETAQPKAQAKVQTKAQPKSSLLNDVDATAIISRIKNCKTAAEVTNEWNALSADAQHNETIIKAVKEKCNDIRNQQQPQQTTLM